MTPLQAVLWDLDGVLVDSAQYHYEAFRQLMAENGRDFTEGDFQRTFGMRNDAILRQLLGDLSPEREEQLALRKEELFRAGIAGRVRPLPGAAELVERLRSARVPQAIVSSAPRANIDLIVRSLGMEGWFPVIVSGEDVKRGKPDPEGFLTAAERLGVPVDACVVLEDAPEGVAAARAAGMRCVGVATTRPREELAQADLVVERLDERAVGAYLLGAGS